ncbi:MAG TPA: RluA family pseudouridine synthase [Desulfobulbaceae bacterium]|nr:RluA family pseudouridine synthase [Desulfobulbaceae bacterium]
MPELFVVTALHAGLRLDHYLVRRFPDYSRSALGRLIRAGNVLVNNSVVKAGYRIHDEDEITLRFPQPESSDLVAQPIDFGILFEDEELLVIDKPAGLVVHPADGHRCDTLVNGLLYRYQVLPGNETGRPGIVHRLDKDTSGVMVVAKTGTALKALSESFKNRTVAKTYHAVLLRDPGKSQGTLTAAIGRHPVNRKKMAVRINSGRYAVTHWKVLTRWPGFSFVEVGLETGRTHQIRVHMASLGSPVAGDVLYGGRIREGFDPPVKRQLLHASTLCFPHPISKQNMQFTASLPEDMQRVLLQLEKRYS